MPAKRLVRQFGLAAAIVLLAIGFVIILLPGPLGWPGIPFMLLGLVLLLRYSIAARRFFIKLSREQVFYGKIRNRLGKKRQRERQKHKTPPPGSMRG